MQIVFNVNIIGYILLLTKHCSIRVYKLFIDKEYERFT